MAAGARIAVLGIGLMGSRMAPRLIDAGHDVTVWNRTREKALPLVEKGATLAETPAEAVTGADVVIVMLEHGGIVGEVLFGMPEAAVKGLAKGSLLIDMSSIRPAEAREHAARLAEAGVDYLDAPVSGGTVGAEAGTLAIMCGGSAEDFDRAEPILRKLGTPTLVGPIGSGQLAKLINQLIVGATIGAVAEGLAMASAGGADPASVRKALMGGFAQSRVLDLHGQRMVDRDFETKGRTVTHLKDLRNACAAAEEIGFTAPFLDQTTQLFADLAAHEGDPDHSALILEIERMNRPGKADG
ncbi:NAD(P)-dependent oxidoreductase [Jiella avicenniae]|uniref:NAD(P)-dependent oxidoreductase n=1 Tax=Jiella avicenniae TaxID=2907202 RepID=A0A9X1P573_9HYPH|nr:NAD(P)-dependent oxidoreductase [Jiella avicenniae]MCE7029466.1 NAD(P)-dependent oxidoreductase [Jiella avicenniae]